MWKPIRTRTEVERLVTDRAPEGLHLDFKQGPVPWNDKDGKPAREEAAKDVAAFANAYGGTIVAGIGETQAHASGWAPVRDGERLRHEVAGWLGQELKPREFAERVELLVIEVDVGAVLVINVPPWPGAPVSAGWSKTKGAMRFPVRRDRQTDFMTASEAFARADAARRRTYLRLRELHGDKPHTDVRVHSPVVARSGPVDIPIRPPLGERHGFLEGVGEETLSVVMTNKDRHAIAWQHADKQRDVEHSSQGLLGHRASSLHNAAEELGRGSWNGGNGEAVQFPLAFVREVWSTPNESGRAAMINLALDGSLVFDGKVWTVELRQ